MHDRRPDRSRSVMARIGLSECFERKIWQSAGGRDSQALFSASQSAKQRYASFSKPTAYVSIGGAGFCGPDRLMRFSAA